MKLFVGNLSFKTTEADLKRCFEEIGPVTEAAVVTDRETGRSRGFGFVTMNDADGQKAIQSLNGQPLGGRQINVNEARPNPKGAYSGERGGGR